MLHRVTEFSAAAEPRDDFGEDTEDAYDVAHQYLAAEDGWVTYTTSPEISLPPPEKSLPPLCHSFFPSAAKEVEFGTAITTVDESIVSNAGEAIDWEAEVKEDTPTGEEKRQMEGRHRHCGEVRGEGSEERMVLSSGKC